MCAINYIQNSEKKYLDLGNSLRAIQMNRVQSLATNKQLHDVQTS